jgi:hypothetical protein
MLHRNYKNPLDWGITIFALLILFSYMLIIPIPSGVSDGTGDYPAPNNGDWTIENDTHISNESITVHGSINVTNNATLTLENVDLLINSTSSDVKEIYVNWGAALKLFNSSLSTIGGGYYSFEVNGIMTIESSNISRTTGGILIKNNSVVISNSTFHHNHDNALVCFDNPIIANNYIHSNYNGVGILTNYYSAPYIYNNTIKFNEWGVKSITVGLSTIARNDISHNTYDGIKVELGYLLIKNNTIYSNGEFGIRSDHAYINVSNNSIYDNGRWGIYSLGTPIIQRDNFFERDGVYNGDGDVVLEWEVDLKTFDHNNESLFNVNLTIHNENDELVWNGTTVGNLRNLVFRDYEIIDNGTELIHSYTVNASLGNFYNITEFDLIGAHPSIYASKTVYINIDVKEIDDVEEGEVKDHVSPPWLYPVVGMIWFAAFIIVIVGLAVIFRKRQY